MRQSFFAYGSFAEGQVHHSKFSNLIFSQKKACLKAGAYRLRCGYPLVHVDENSDLIEGVLYELDATDSFWILFDQLIGVDSSDPDLSLLRREKVPVLLKDFTEVHAFVYTLNPEKVGQTQAKITNGDWRKSMKENPPLPDFLERSHRAYINKLAKVRGRDLVPYKLDICRRLEALELIKDKGRRPALTSLGREVSLFLQ